MKRSFRVVASYTTIPGRYEELIRSVKSLKKQTVKLDCIYLTIPEKVSRTGEKYPHLPKKIHKWCTIMYSDRDYGPLTKLRGALFEEKNPNTIIISCDDDVIFKRDHVETLLRHHFKNPGAVICGTGALIGKGLPFINIHSNIEPFNKWNWLIGPKLVNKGRYIDLVFGVSGVLYTRGMFHKNNAIDKKLFRYCFYENSIYCNDDVLISGYLSNRGVKRMVFGDIPPVTHCGGADALSGNVSRMIKRLNRAIYDVKKLGFFNKLEPVYLTETPAVKIGLIILLLLLIVMVAIVVMDW